MTNAELSENIAIASIGRAQYELTAAAQDLIGRERETRLKTARNLLRLALAELDLQINEATS